ncbi:MAG: ABC transporter substrate-binding protein, partial [Acidimicrobiales bacterium]
MMLGAVLLAGCSSSGATKGSTTTTAPAAAAAASGSSGASSAPGITPTQIKVGAISTLTGAIAANFKAFSPGMQAYFDMVNAQGGINGRRLVLADNLDDGGLPSTFTQLSHTLLQQDHVFAVATSTYWFSPSLFVQ